MVSTRLQSNSNSNCTGDNSMMPSPEGLQKCSCSTGCVTRSGANTHPTTCHSKDIQSKTAMHLMNLPIEIIQKIISFCGYKTTSNLRLVNKDMDQICGSLLNLTFNKLQNLMLARFHGIKAQMPRRESARRQHPLACEFDIIETIYMRLNLLHMTFGKHIEKKMMYFFPGEVLDEVYRILYYIKVTPKLPRPYRVTDELFDLTTMAMEYFKEKLEPSLPEITHCGSDRMNYSPIRVSPAVGTNNRILFDEPNSVKDFSIQSLIDEDSNQSYPPQSNMVLRKRIRKIKQGMKLYNSQLATMKRELKAYKTKMADQQKTILDYAARLDENDKKNEEMSRKYSTLLQELNKCKTELQYWRSISPLNPNPVCGACGEPVATLPVEDLEVLSNQGIIIPMVVVQPLPTHDEEVVEKIKIDETTLKEVNNMCLKNDEKASGSEENNAIPISNKDQNECNVASSSSSTESNNISSNNLLRPTKRKQISEKPSSHKRPRGILKLRNKTIRIMK